MSILEESESPGLKKPFIRMDVVKKEGSQTFSTSESLQLLEVKLGSVQSYPTPIVFFVYFRTILGVVSHNSLPSDLSTFRS